MGCCRSCRLTIQTAVTGPRLYAEALRGLVDLSSVLFLRLNDDVGRLETVLVTPQLDQASVCLDGLFSGQ